VAIEARAIQVKRRIGDEQSMDSSSVSARLGGLRIVAATSQRAGR